MYKFKAVSCIAAVLCSALILCGCASNGEPGEKLAVSLPEEYSTYDFAEYMLYYQAESADEFTQLLKDRVFAIPDYGVGELVKNRISEDGTELLYPSSDELLKSACIVVTPVDSNNRSFTLGDIGELGEAAADEIADVSLEVYSVIEYDGKTYMVEGGLPQEQISDNYDNVYTETVGGVDVSFNCRMRATADGEDTHEVAVLITYVQDGGTVYIRPYDPAEYTEYLDLPEEFFAMQSLDLSEIAE